MKAIVLDSAPLGLLTQRIGVADADNCRRWMAARTMSGLRIVIPEIIDYELRRELIRAGKTSSVSRLNQFLLHPSVDYLPLTTAAMRLAAELWAQIRSQGLPTADPLALDIDVILAAQVTASGIPLNEAIVATSNAAHIGRFLQASDWTQI